MKSKISEEFEDEDLEEDDVADKQDNENKKIKKDD
jgi:hypothetical protein